MRHLDAIREILGSIPPDPVMAGRKLEDLTRDATVAYIAEFASGLAASRLSPEEFRRSRDHLDEWWDRLADLDRGVAAPEPTDGIYATDPAAGPLGPVVVEASVDEASVHENTAEPGLVAEISGNDPEAAVDDGSAAGPASRVEPDQVPEEAAAAVWDVAAAEGVVETQQKSNWFAGGDLWRAANLLLLRLSATRADDLRARLAEATGLEPGCWDRVLVPGYAGSEEMSLDARHGAVQEARRPVESEELHPSWVAHKDLLSRLGNVLVLLEMEGEHLRTVHPLLGEGKRQLGQPARIPWRGGSGSGEFTDSSIGYFRAQVGEVLKGEAHADGLRAVMEFTLSVVSNPVPHPDSWWAKNAAAAVDHARTALTMHGVEVEGLIISEPTARDLRLPRPKWAPQKNMLLWTLMPKIITARGGEARTGRGIYARG